MAANPSQIVALSDDEKASLVEKKATCPFVGTAVAQGVLAVRNEANNPLASIEDIRTLGNSGGGDLGDLLVIFAAGNHAFMRGEAAKLDAPAPQNLFSLELPGSQGSHPGHSGILQGDPTMPGSGRFSQADFDRLLSHARDGLLRRSDVGRFIAENLVKDPKSKVADLNTVELLASDVVNLFETAGSALAGKLFNKGPGATHRDLEEKLTRLTGENNLVGSAGEFGLLFAFLVNKPGARKVSGEPALDVNDVKSMFVDKRFPQGWETWKKSRIDWVTNTTGLLVAAAREYRKLKGT
ncbi:MAG TPA: hypothetical protein VKD91_15520 [Pyrinomonadaceae bacterium]|nr:hypothetical protein [Pyrinomonadaceae bacterium]